MKKITCEWCYCCADRRVHSEVATRRNESGHRPFPGNLWCFSEHYSLSGNNEKNHSQFHDVQRWSACRRAPLQTLIPLRWTLCRSTAQLRTGACSSAKIRIFDSKSNAFQQNSTEFMNHQGCWSVVYGDFAFRIWFPTPNLQNFQMHSALLWIFRDIFRKYSMRFSLTWLMLLMMQTSFSMSSGLTTVWLNLIEEVSVWCDRIFTATFLSKFDFIAAMITWKKVIPSKNVNPMELFESHPSISTLAQSNRRHDEFVSEFLRVSRRVQLFEYEDWKLSICLKIKDFMCIFETSKFHRKTYCHIWHIQSRWSPCWRARSCGPFRSSACSPACRSSINQWCTSLPYQSSKSQHFYYLNFLHDSKRLNIFEKLFKKWREKTEIFILHLNFFGMSTFAK